VSAATGERYTGSRVRRVEDAPLLAGSATFVDDIELPGMLHAAFLRSPYAHARIGEINASAARVLDGVVAVFTGEDLREAVGPFVTTMGRPEVRTCSQRVLPLEKVRHVGEPVAVVVARSRYVAEDAAERIEVEWEPLPAVVDAEVALEPGAPVLDEELGDNNVGHISVATGDVDAAFGRAEHVFSKRFHHGRCAAAPLETRGVVASFERASSELTLWISTQFPHLTRTLLSRPLGVPESRLRIIAPAVGGGFGAKATVFVEDAVIAAVARLVGRPVKWIEDRYENLVASIHAKEVVCYVDIACSAAGEFLAFRGRYVGNGGAYSCNPHTPLVDALNAAVLLPNMYRVRNLAYDVDAPLTNKCQAGAYRAVGWTSGHTARELLIDEIARELSIDPLELRLRNALPPEPYTTPFGQEYDGGSYAESLRRAAELIDYDGFREEQERLRAERRYVGVGFSPYVEPTGWATELARALGAPGGYYDTATVTLEPDGSATVSTGLQAFGQGLETALSQVAADALGVRLEDVRVVQGDTGSTPYTMGSFGSRGAVVGAGIVGRAAADVRERLLQRASTALEVAPEDLEVVDGVISARGVPAYSVTVADVAASAYFGGGSPGPHDEPPLASTRGYAPPQTYSNGTIAAMIEVDAETGEVEFRRLVSVHDCGVMINPAIVEGQIVGAIAQGIGAVLYEDLVYDEDGQLLSGTLMDYLYPSATEVPSIEVAHLETPSNVTASGVKGIGQAGMLGAGAAVVNAIADALAPFRARIEKTPLRPSDILELIVAAEV
jgi:carbon-monoxide dehydrogenase large subunit